MRYLTVGEVLDIHRLLVEISGGAAGVRDLHAVESAVAQPEATLDGTDRYTSLAEKSAALGYSSINNHPSVDGNKRIGHATMDVFPMPNGHELDADVDEAEQLVLGVADGRLSRLELTQWLQAPIKEKD